MDRRRLLERLDKAWMAFKESYAGLSEAELLEPGVTGDWSVRDIIAHVTTWDEEALTHLPSILDGGKPPRYSVTYGGIDAFNALMTKRKESLPLAEVLRQLDDTHRRLVEVIDRAPADHARDALPPPPAPGHVRPLPQPRGGDMPLARAARPAQNVIWITPGYSSSGSDGRYHQLWRSSWWFRAQSPAIGHSPG